MNPINSQEDHRLIGIFIPFRSKIWDVMVCPGGSLEYIYASKVVGTIAKTIRAERANNWFGEILSNMFFIFHFARRFT